MGGRCPDWEGGVQNTLLVGNGIFSFADSSWGGGQHVDWGGGTDPPGSPRGYATGWELANCYRANLGEVCSSCLAHALDMPLWGIPVLTTECVSRTCIMEIIKFEFDPTSHILEPLLHILGNAVNTVEVFVGGVPP